MSERRYININRAFVRILQELIEQGDEVRPRGSLTLEIAPFSFSVASMDQNALLIKERRLNPYFMMSESLWMLGGLQDITPLKYFMPGVAKFYDDPITFGAYGPRFVDQLEYVVDALARDRTTRQAVMTFWRPELWQAAENVRQNTKDVPCTISHQYLFRNGKLHLIVYMRSNDVWKGLTYDFFNFTQMAKVVASHLGVQLGDYHHFCGSMHLYETDYYAASKVAKIQAETLSAPAAGPAWYDMGSPPSTSYFRDLLHDMAKQDAEPAAPSCKPPEALVRNVLYRHSHPDYKLLLDWAQLCNWHREAYT